MISFRITTSCSNCGKIIPRDLEDNKPICYECLLKTNNMNNIKYGWVCPLCKTVNNPIIMECKCNNITLYVDHNQLAFDEMINSGLK